MAELALGSHLKALSERSCGEVYRSQGSAIESLGSQCGFSAGVEAEASVSGITEITMAMGLIRRSTRWLKRWAVPADGRRLVAATTDQTPVGGIAMGPVRDAVVAGLRQQLGPLMAPCRRQTALATGAGASAFERGDPPPRLRRGTIR